MRNGEILEQHFFLNEDGLNVTDSPFRIAEGAATAGQNYEYSSIGAIVKRGGHAKLNTTANPNALSKGLGLHITSTNVKTVVTASERNLQNWDITLNTFTSLTEDTTAASTNVFPLSSTIAAVAAQFNTDVLASLNWAGNTSTIYTQYSSTKYTQNGVVTPSGGPIAAAQLANSGGSWSVTGNYRYAVSYNKASTTTEGNAFAGTTFDVSATLTTTTGTILVTLNTLTTVDITKYPTMNIYRSTVGGSQGFTSGSLVTTVPSNTVTYTDTGTAATVSTLIPRANSTVLDNSPLPSGTFNCVTTWKRRLVTATGSQLLISDINKPESWPTVNRIFVPSGGPITALGIISFNTEYGNDEYLAVFKENELWVVKGNSYLDFTLSFVDTTGCPSQSLLVFANGLLTWVSYRGIFAWDGSNKPTYLSRPLEGYFNKSDQLDKSKLARGVGLYIPSKKVVQWALPHQTYGDNKFCIKLDIRLTAQKLTDGLSGRVSDGIFTLDILPFSNYSSVVLLPGGSFSERVLMGDNAGFFYDGYSAFVDVGNPISFAYRSKYFDFGSPNTSKRFLKVVVKVSETSPKNLLLDYWTDYRADEASKSVTQTPISNTFTTGPGFWDVSLWDQARWDSFATNIGSLVFNLSNDQGNAEGDSLQIQFRNTDATEPITIYGFSVYYQEISVRK